MGFADNLQEAGSQLGQVLDPTQAADPQLEQNLRENPGPTSALLSLSDRLQGAPTLPEGTDTRGFEFFGGTGDDSGLVVRSANQVNPLTNEDGSTPGGLQLLFGLGVLALLAVAFGQLFNINVGGGQ